MVSVLTALLVTNNIFAANIYHYDWPDKNKTSWKITSMGASKVKQAVQFQGAKKHGIGTQSIPEASVGYQVRGGVVTEKHYVFALYKDDESTNFVYFANRLDDKIAKVVSGKWIKMNNLYYDWGTKHVRVESGDNKDGCIHDETFKSISTKDCKTKRADVYGAKGLTSQGQAQADGYVYNASWDSGDAKYGQKWYGQRNSNAIFIYKQGTKQLVKTLYVPKTVVNGELKDVAIDGNGDAYLIFNQSSPSAGVSFYKIDKKDVGTTKDKATKSSDGSSGGSSSGSSGSGSGSRSSSGGGSGGSGSGSGSSSSGSGSSGGSSGGDPSTSGGGSSGSIGGDDDDESGIDLAPQREQQCAIILSLFCENVEADGEKTIFDMLAFGAGVFTMGFGFLTTVNLIVSGYMYLTARENEYQIIKAKRRIRETLLGLLLWILIVACVGLLLPGTNSAIDEVIQGAIILQQVP